MKTGLTLGANVALAILCLIILPSIALSAAVYHSVRYRDEKPWQRRTPSRFFYPDGGVDYSAGSSIRRESVYREPAPVPTIRKDIGKDYYSKPSKNVGGYSKSKDFFRIKKRKDPFISNDISGSTGPLFDREFRNAKFPKSYVPTTSYLGRGRAPTIGPDNTKNLYAGGLVYLRDFRPGSPIY